jgi:A/G-specific adenine glycosylase
MLVEIARTVIREGLPRTMDELVRLPGVGTYTAAAWLSLHRGQRAVIVDANVARWLSRMTGMQYSRDPRHVRWVNELAAQLTPPRVFRDYNYAVLDFTMTVCQPRLPRCRVCPVRRACREGSGSTLQWLSV